MIIDTLFADPIVFLAWLIAILVSLTIHEFAHAYFAFLQGDPTPRLMGRISFNPLRHIDVFGFIALLIIGFGWGKPVPVNPVYFKNKKWGEAIVSIVGPLTNLFLAILFGVILKIVWVTGNFAMTNMMIIFLYNLVVINIVLCLFNLIPISPLDGSHVLFAILPDKFNEFKYQLSKQGPMVLMIIIFADIFLNLGIFERLFSFFLNFANSLIF